MSKKSKHIDDNSRSVLESMFTTFYPVLAAYCSKYIMDKETIRDTIQDIFLKVWENRHQVDFSMPLHSYLLKLAHNRCLNHLQRSKMEQKYRNELAVQSLELEMQYDYMFDQLVADELQKQIDQVVEQLPAQCRDIFCKSRYEGMSNRDIALDLNISVRTVETQIYRALKTLKKNLKNF